MINKFTIGSLFNYKDKLPTCLRSSLVYKFSCAHCASVYIGSTCRALFVRVAEHADRSFRTGHKLNNPNSSSIRDHTLNCNSPIKLDQFSILNSAKNFTDVRILESIYIHKLKPSINNCEGAIPLHILSN